MKFLMIKAQAVKLQAFVRADRKVRSTIIYKKKPGGCRVSRIKTEI